MTQTSPLLQTH